MIETLFESYPFMAGLAIGLASLLIGAIEMKAVKSRGPVLLTWTIGAMATVSPLLTSPYSIALKSGGSLFLFALYLLCAYWIWKRKSSF